MYNRVEAMANEAVFVLQFNTNEAVRYIQRNARVDEKTAKKAFKDATTFHRQPKVDQCYAATV